MSERKKYIGKKRQKIFSIEKNDIQKTQTKSSNKKIDLSQKNTFIPLKDIQHPSPKKISLNLNKKKDKINTESQKHSLICISKLVFEYIKKVVYTTGNEVTEHIKNILHSKKNDRLNQKNIQRRVYDAINVMCAVGLIKKNKQKIQFLQNDSEENEDNNSNKDLNINEKEKINFEGKIKDKLYELEEKRKKLAKNYIKLKFYEKYSFLNNNLAQNKDKNKLEFPFDIITYDNSSPIKITSKEDLSRYLILSNTVLVHLTPYDIIKKLIAPDLLLKLNENYFVDCKSSSKKSTNDNSIIDELNYNINNEISNLDKKEKISEQISQNNKLFSRNYTHLNYRQETPGKTNEEKGEELVFDYLKDKKCFLNELLNTNENHEEIINVEISDINKSRKESENILEKENENPFNENGLRKNSNLSYESNFFDENTIKRNKCDLISELEIFK